MLPPLSEQLSVIFEVAHSEGLSTQPPLVLEELLSATTVCSINQVNIRGLCLLGGRFKFTKMLNSILTHSISLTHVGGKSLLWTWV